MIFGKTNNEKSAERLGWTRCFAFLPRRLWVGDHLNGQWIWRENVLRSYDGYMYIYKRG